MVEYVVGDWKDFTFRMLTMDDLEDVRFHTRNNFLKYESLNILLGWSEGNVKDHDELVAGALPHGLSFGVFTKDTHEMIGFNLILNGQLEFGVDPDIPRSKVFKTIIECLNKAAEESDAEFRKQFDTSNYAEIFMTSVAKGYGGKGLATEMYRRSFKFLKGIGFTVVKSTFSSPGTQAIGKKLEFSEIGRMYLKDYRNEDGEQVFASAPDDQFIKEVAKNL